MKLLAPVGNMDSLQAAINNGADEIYLGVNRYNARNNIDCFDPTTLCQAVQLAHLYGVRVNLTVNILFADAELTDALRLVVQAYNMGVDAFIVQDSGLAYLIHRHYPAIVLHASTQMGVHNLEGVQALRRLGFRRVVLARETPLTEIKRIRRNSDIEIEYFVHGALCVSFSGNCYLSERLLGASGNRGRCKQLCRQVYTLRKQGVDCTHGFLLSAKDFCLIDRLQQLQQAGVDVLKIEGRARRPGYVALTTRQYRLAIDGQPYDMDKLRLAFNRLYTPGYFEGNGNIISPYNNHIGIKVGTVDNVQSGKRFNEVFLSTDRPIYPKSVLKLYRNNCEVQTLTAYDITPLAKGKYRLTTTQDVQKGCDVHLIADAELEAQALSTPRRRPLHIDVCAAVGHPITATCTLDGCTVTAEGAVCMAARNQPLQLGDLQDNFEKNDIFAPVVQANRLENVFLTKKDLNQWRRTLYADLQAAITARYTRAETSVDIAMPHVAPTVDVCVVEQCNQPLWGKRAVYSPSDYIAHEVMRFAERCHSQNIQPFLDTPNWASQSDIQILQNIVAQAKVGIVAHNYYALQFDCPILIGGGLNVYNSVSAALYAGKDALWPQVQGIVSSDGKGMTLPYMTLRHCPLKAHLGADCAQCPYQEGMYEYVMENGKVMRLRRKRIGDCTFYLTD